MGILRIFTTLGLLTGSLSYAANPLPSGPLDIDELFNEVSLEELLSKGQIEKNSTPLDGPRYWFLGSPSEGVEGVRVTEAVKNGVFEGRNPQPILVAVLDSGIDINHPDLKDHIWKNEGENCELDGTGMDGLDNDGNGYVDDCRGWNVLGTVLTADDALEGELPHRSAVSSKKVKLKNGDEVTFLNIDYAPFTASDEIGRLQRKSEVEELTDDEKSQLKRAQKIYEEDARLYDSYGYNSPRLAQILDGFDEHHYEMIALVDRLAAIYDLEKAKHGDVNVWPFVFESAQDALRVKETDKFFAKFFKGQLVLQTFAKMDETSTREDLVSGLRNTLSDYSGYFAISRKNVLFNTNYGVRELVMTESRSHGNPNVIGRDPQHGTYVAHVIVKILTEAGVPFKIIPVRTLAEGDEHDDDVMAAMKYAVKNGAVVANGSWGKDVSPKWQEVLQTYRESVVAASERTEGGKTFLMSHAAGNDGRNNKYDIHFPNRFVPVLDDQGKFVEWRFDSATLTGWIETGASTSKRSRELLADFSNYGKETVHLFAPGAGIWSAQPWGGEKNWQGTSAASPMTAGVAGVIASYFPELDQAQLEKSILATRTDELTDLAVFVPGSREGDSADAGEISVLDRLSVTGGLLDLINAAKVAGELAK